MRRIQTTAAAAFLAALAVWVIAAQEAPSTSGPVNEIQMTAKKYEFDPSTIRVKKGDHVKLVITASDHEHGFKLDAWKINRKLPKGETVTVEFTADQTGTFPFACSHFCGLGHKGMKGELIVE